jgi:hypothetical protein
MPAIQQSKQPNVGRGKFEESAAEKESWFALRQYIRAEDIKPGETFQLAGTIAKFLFDGTPENPRYFVKKQVTDKGEEKDWSYVKVLCAVTDPRFGKPGTLTFPPKNVGSSFFDGHMGDNKPRSPLRGGMYNIHFAVTGQEPPQVLIDGEGDWETDWYENKPVMLTLKFVGYTPEDSRYAGTKADLAVFVNGFARNRQASRPPTPRPTLEAAAQVTKRRRPRGVQRHRAPAQVHPHPSGARPGWTPTRSSSTAWSCSARKPTRSIAARTSTLIDALQRRRQNTPDPTPAAAGQAAAAGGSANSDDDENF